MERKQALRYRKSSREILKIEANQFRRWFQLKYKYKIKGKYVEGRLASCGGRIIKNLRKCIKSSTTAPFVAAFKVWLHCSAMTVYFLYFACMTNRNKTYTHQTTNQPSNPFTNNYSNIINNMIINDFDLVTVAGMDECGFRWSSFVVRINLHIYVGRELLLTFQFFILSFFLFLTYRFMSLCFSFSVSFLDLIDLGSVSTCL